MKRFTFIRLRRTLLMMTAVVVGAIFSSAVAQDSSYIPIRVESFCYSLEDFGVTVTAVPRTNENGANTVVLLMKSREVDTLQLPYVRMTTGVSYFGGQRHTNATKIVANRRGNVTVNLPAQSYKSADVALYTVNGKRVMSGKVSSLNAVNNISRRNVATGVYLLSVRGENSEAITARLTHSGGGLSINTAFTGESGNAADARKIAKEVANIEAMTWTVTVSADGYDDSVFVIQPIKWDNPLQTVKLSLYAPPYVPPVVVKGKFTDARDGTEYKIITLTGEQIGSQTWMAENLNYATRVLNGNGAWCNDCVKYGRLYDWPTAITVCPTGWHLPTPDEWQALQKATGRYKKCEYDFSGQALKSTSGWNDFKGESGNGTDDFGFSALPGGIYRSAGYFSQTGDSGYWWTATDMNSIAYCMGLQKEYSALGAYGNDKDDALSVRCVMD